MAKSILEATATVRSEKEFSKTNAQFAEIVDWFISDYAGEMPPEMDTVLKQNNWKLGQAHNKLIEYLVRDSRRLRLQQLRAGQASLEDQATLETQL